MKWMEALKEWNKSQPKWKIPKKDTAGYKAVKALMDKKPAKKTKCKATVKLESFEEIFKEVEAPKRKRGRPKKSKA